MSTVSIDDFRKPDGTTDWAAYERAGRACGDKCTRCGTFIFAKQPGECVDCARLGRPAQVDHPHYVRCPACMHVWSPYHHEQYEVLHDGEHEISCHQCDHEFTVSTRVTFTFTSPARAK
jgi:DNA-directed RNA polymerase subunit RPC12/RpoP